MVENKAVRGRGIPPLQSMVRKVLPEHVLFNWNLKDKKTAKRRKGGSDFTLETQQVQTQQGPAR